VDRWKLRYPIRVPKASPFPGYPSLGLSFAFEDDTLVAIQHELDVPDGGDALALSLPSIRGLLELLEFHWRMTARIELGEGVVSTLIHEDTA
jgi:hypothetical protein